MKPIKYSLRSLRTELNTGKCIIYTRPRGRCAADVRTLHIPRYIPDVYTTSCSSTDGDRDGGDWGKRRIVRSPHTVNTVYFLFYNLFGRSSVRRYVFPVTNRRRGGVTPVGRRINLSNPAAGDVFVYLEEKKNVYIYT